LEVIEVARRSHVLRSNPEDDDVIGDCRSPVFHEDGDMGLKRYKRNIPQTASDFEVEEKERHERWWGFRGICQGLRESAGIRRKCFL
jgi:hypothetical protein